MHEIVLVPEFIDITSLPSVALSDCKQLPNKSGVYLVLSPSNKVLYVGYSEKIFQRWKNGHHRQYAFNQLKNLRIAYIEVDAPLLKETEQKLIDRFNPPFNGNSLHKPTESVTFTVNIPVDKAAILYEKTEGDLDKWLEQRVDYLITHT